MAIAGGCLCGAVRFEVAADAPLVARRCWCRVCQYIGAGGGTLNATFPRNALTVSGPLVDYDSVADSGSAMRRRFCAACGTPLFSEAAANPHLIVVRVGAFDDPGVAPPQAIIWTRSAPQWACFEPDLPQYERGAPAPKA